VLIREKCKNVQRRESQGPELKTTGIYSIQEIPDTRLVMSDEIICVVREVQYTIKC